jgi:hypothetical protein
MRAPRGTVDDQGTELVHGRRVMTLRHCRHVKTRELARRGWLALKLIVATVFAQLDFDD